jgi:hypothetical protein
MISNNWRDSVYLILESKTDQELAPIQRYGHWLHHTVGYLPPEAESRTDLTKYNGMVVPENVAKAWKFAGISRDYISVKPNTFEKQIFAESMEPLSEKIKYYLTEDDIANTVLFMKAVMTKMLHMHYNRELEKLNLKSSNVEMISWDEQKKEAFAYMSDNTVSTPVLTVLATERNITVFELASKVVEKVNQYNIEVATLLSKQQIIDQLIKNANTIKDLNVVLHTRFGIHMPYSQQEEEGIETEPEFNL